MSDYFKDIPTIKSEGRDSTNPLSFKFYDANKKILGKTLEEHLRMAVCYWHTFNWPGGDPFGGQTFLRPWMEAGDKIEQAKDKLNNAFDFFEKLGIPYFCFHDVDVAPEGKSFSETEKIQKTIIDEISKKLETSKVKLLWGTANLFSHRRYMSGAATNPDPDVFQYAAAQVKMCMENTMFLGGQNYVLWGGREGYETILNTNMKQEYDQLGRFLNMVAEHKHKIGFKGLIISDDISMRALSKNILYNAQKAILSGCNLALYCKGNYRDSLKLLKKIPPIDAFTSKKTSEFYKFLG